jgi:ABC-2 type transport system permease protein
VEIYSKLLQAILLWVVPFAFVAFVPATHFLARESFAWYVRLLPVVALVAGAIGATCWTLGVRHYESTGS